MSGVTTVIAAVADALGEPLLTAVIFMFAGEDESVAGAVYMPDVETTPVVVSPPKTPFTSQAKDVLVVPLIVAVNCCDAPVLRVAAVGEMPTTTGVIVKDAEAKTEGFVWLVAVTVTVRVEGATAGAW